MRRGGTGRVPLRARDTRNGGSPEKERRPDANIITWMKERRTFTFQTLNVSDDDDERSRRVSCALPASVFMLSGILNLGVPLQTLRLAARV